MTEMVAAWKPTSPPAVWSLRTGARVGLLLDDPGFLNPASVSFSPNQKIVAVGGARDGSAAVFDLSTGRPLLRLNTRPQVHTKAVQFSPDGQRILTTNSDGEARLWNATTGKPIGPVVRMPGSLRSPVFSRDGRWVLERGRWDRERWADNRYQQRRGGGSGDRDRDGVPNSVDRDKDGDGVPNRYDSNPNNPNRQ